MTCSAHKSNMTDSDLVFLDSFQDQQVLHQKRCFWCILPWIKMPMSDSLFILVTDTHIYQAWSKSLVYSSNQYCMHRYLTYYEFDFNEKYAIIVWYEKVRYLGEDKLKKFFFYLSIVYPFYILAAFHLVRPDFLSAFKGFSHSYRYFG